MANIIIFEKITKRVKEYLKSVHTPDYIGRKDCLINPRKLPIASSEYWKVENEQVLEMNQTEKDAVNLAEKNQAKLDRLDSAQSVLQTLQDDIQYLKDNFTNNEIIELAKRGDLSARILVLKVLYSQADTATKKFKVLAKFNRLIEWEA